MPAFQPLKQHPSVASNCTSTMARPQPVQQLALLEIILRRHPNGASITDIARELAPPPENRTLERWLTMLIEQHRATQLASGDGPLYAAIAPAEPPPASAAAAPVATGPVPAAQPPSETASASTETNPETRFAELFDDAVVQIVVAAMPKGATTAVLQMQAARERIPLAQRLVYVAYAKQRLEALTRDEAEKIGILPENFDAWRRGWAETPTVPPPKPPAPVASPSTETVAPRMMARPTPDPEADDPVVQLADPETPRPAARTAAATRGGTDELAEVLKGLNLAHTIPMLASTVALGKELFTWKRVAIAIGWGLLVTYGIQRVLPASGSLSLLQVPLIGLPWYGFLLMARRGGKPAPREIVVALAGGGAVTTFLVGIVYPILLQLTHGK
ncbi:MAG TPA: hypothetical protein VHE61_20370 [Opitutaceae bacterium]|nr:hypothetical protein [Opitutaceae bacterium]